VTFDLTSRRFFTPEGGIDLPARELALLELLFTRAGKVVSKEAIVQSLTPIEGSLSDNAIEQYISRLRRRLSPHGVTLRTARGIGYFLEKAPGT
jgi:two-component system, OmpR family, response regulator